MRSGPKVSIGLPVRNGEAYLAGAIEALLGQTYRHLELIISDNASTDATEAICRDFARRDPRVRYLRQTRNIGAAANFNLTFEQASGRYFKWAAHDDLVAPGYVTACVERLEAEPDAVLCQSVVRIVDEGGRCLEVYDHTAFGTDRPDRVARFAARVRARRCMDVFGLIRTDALRGTALITREVGADRTLLVELALRGRFLGVPAPLFVNRDHPRRFTRRYHTPRQQAGWYAPAGTDRRALRTWGFYRSCLDLIDRYVSDRSERMRCRLALLASVRLHRRWLRLALEPIDTVVPGAMAFEPWLVGRAVTVRRALRGGSRRGAPEVANHD